MSELEALIAAQEKDDTYRVQSVSVDAWPSGADIVHVPRKLKLAAIPHGTLTGAKWFRCKCDECRAASAAHARDLRRRKGTKTKYVCQCCGSDNVRRMPNVP